MRLTLRLLFSRALIALVAAVAPFAGSAQDVRQDVIEIELREEVVSQQRQMSLGDVAHLRTVNLPAMRRLIALPLGEAPKPGGEVVVDREMIARWIQSQLGIAGTQLLWRGAKEGRIKGGYQVPPATQIEQTARLELERWLALRSTRFNIDSSGTPGDLRLEVGRLELRARPVTAGSRLSRRMVVWVDAWVDGVFARTIPVSFNVDAYNDAWITRSFVAAGAILSPAMVERAEVNVAGQSSEIVAPGANPGGPDLGLRSARILKAGEALNSQNTRVQMAVNRGDWVKLNLRTGSLQLEGRAEALQEGGVGQMVKVRVAGASSSVEALVVERGRVEAVQ